MDDIRLLSALSDKTRLRIVKILLAGSRCACELPKMVGKAQPTVSLQLKKLAVAGVLSVRREGTKSIYSVKNPKVAKLLKLIST